jgi:hypothetical protein
MAWEKTRQIFRRRVCSCRSKTARHTSRRLKQPGPHTLPRLETCNLLAGQNVPVTTLADTCTASGPFTRLPGPKHSMNGLTMVILTRIRGMGRPSKSPCSVLVSLFHTPAVQGGRQGKADPNATWRLPRTNAEQVRTMVKRLGGRPRRPEEANLTRHLTCSMMQADSPLMQILLGTEKKRPLRKAEETQTRCETGGQSCEQITPR